jgi:VanZ family protein
VRGTGGWYREIPGRPWWIAIGWLLAAAIVVLSLVSLPQIGPDIPQGDKYKHLLAYLALTLWFAQITASRRALLVHATLFVFLGAALEGLQSLTPDRRLEVADMLANATGVALAVALALAGLDRVLPSLARAGKPRADGG